MSINAKDFIDHFVLPLWNKKTLEVADVFVAPTADIQTTLLAGSGPRALKDNVQKIFRAFSAFEFDVKDVIQKDKHIIYRWTGNGIHIGEVLNIQPTGQKLTFSGIVLGTIQEKFIVRYHSFSDMPRILSQAVNAINIPKESTDPCQGTEYIIAKIKAHTGKKLTKREIECLKLWLQGFSIKHTARMLGDLSCRTIQTFRENIKRKLNVSTYQQLFNLIYHNGMIPLFLVK
jgi:predicted ester cyclase/DNA-binding CsgD family transcriptional regulator